MTTILLKNAHHKKVKVQPTFTQVISGQGDQEWFYSFVTLLSFQIFLL